MPIGPVAVEYEWTTEIHLISAAAARNVSHSMRSGRQDARTNGLAGGLWEIPCFTGSLGTRLFFGLLGSKRPPSALRYDPWSPKKNLGREAAGPKQLFFVLVVVVVVATLTSSSTAS